MNLLKSKDFFLFKSGTSAPSTANGYLTDGNISITENPVTYDVNFVGEGLGNEKDTSEVKTNVPISLSANIALMEPTDIASGMPQKELLAACGFEQIIDTTNNKITLYPTIDAVQGEAVYYKGGVMKYIIHKMAGIFSMSASAANTKVTGTLDLQGSYDPASVVNETGVNPTFTKNDYFKLTKDSYVTVNGAQKCPFGDITISMNSDINDGSDSVVCRDIVIEDIAPMLSFSEVLDSTGNSNLLPITNWLNDSDVVISFPLFSENYKMEVKINAGKEKKSEGSESGLKWLQTRNIRLKNDANGRPFELVITPV